MPKRVVDGDALWHSEKLASVEPVWVRSEYANLIPLALANGVFECDPKRIWSEVYSYNRPYIGIEEVKAILAALERARLLFRWKDPSGKEWGYWTNSDKPGRLPPAAHRARFLCGPEPPREELRRFLAGGNNHKSGVAPESVQLGIGIGWGMGSGKQGGREAEEAREVKEGKKAGEAEEAKEAEKVKESEPCGTRCTAEGKEWSEVVGSVRYYYAGDRQGYRKVVRVERIGDSQQFTVPSPE